MKLYKIINETQIEEFPNWIKKDGIVYTNDQAIDLAIKSKLWFPLIINEVPQFDNETQQIRRFYYLKDESIVLDWVVYNINTLLDANLE
jgi:hypothetical protein